jgi:hypothetical protein
VLSLIITSAILGDTVILYKLFYNIDMPEFT